MFGWLIPIGNCLFNFVKHLSSVAQFLLNISWHNCDIPRIGQICWKKWWYWSDMKEMFAIICVNVILSLTAGRTEINVLFGRSTLNLIFNFFVYTWARIRWGGRSCYLTWWKLMQIGVEINQLSNQWRWRWMQRCKFKMRLQSAASRNMFQISPQSRTFWILKQRNADDNIWEIQHVRSEKYTACNIYREKHLPYRTCFKFHLQSNILNSFLKLRSWVKVNIFHFNL